MSAADGRNKALVRVLVILRLLNGRGRYTVEELAERMTVSTRTVRRDLLALRRAGYPVGHEVGGPWWMEVS